MAFIEKFSGDEQDVLVSLPYRAGLWISKADSAGGEASGEQERQALEEIIAKKSCGMFETAFVHEVMAESFIRKPQWHSWAADSESIGVDCNRAVKAIARVLGEREVGAYRKSVMDIAVGVAQAFQEFDSSPSLLSRLPMLKSVNISYKENAALAKLSVFLEGGKT